MQIDADAARRMFSAMGVDAGEWGTKKLSREVNRLDAYKGSGMDSLSGDDDRLGEDIMACLDAGEEVEVTSSEPAPSAARSVTKGGKKVTIKVTSAKKAAGTAKASKEPAPRDPFGSRVGTKKAQFNAALGTTPMTMTELCKEAGMEGESYYNHANDLVEKGLLKKDAEGRYSLVAKMAKKLEKVEA